MRPICLAIAALACPIPFIANADAQPDGSGVPEITANPETGQCGGAVASRAREACKYVAHARPGVGVFCPQHFSVKPCGAKALDLLARKKLPEEVLVELLKNDQDAGGRQLAIIA